MYVFFHRLQDILILTVSPTLPVQRSREFSLASPSDLWFLELTVCGSRYLQCQGKDWKAGHKPVCLDLPQDDDASIEEARRKALLRLYGRTVTPHSGARSKMD